MTEKGHTVSETMAAQDGADTRIGTKIAGYRIERLLGRGGMGTVYLAEDLALGRKVALKLLSPELSGDNSFRERFQLESRLAASIDHPHVIPIYEAGQTDDGTLFIVMRYVDGADLKEILSKDGALDPQRAVELLTQTARGLDAAHERGLVHRDVKPSNVLVAISEARREHVYLADFGLTRSSASAEAARESILLSGSIDYVSPEQIEGADADQASDVYALGCMAYECLTGQVPFPRPSESAVLFAHLEDAPPPPADIQQALPDTVDAVVDKALAKDPGERYESGAELADAIRRAVTAPRRRHRGRRIAVGVALITIIALAAAVPAVLLTGDDGASARTGDAWAQVPPEEGVFGGPGSLMAQAVVAASDLLVAAGWDDSGPTAMPRYGRRSTEARGSARRPTSERSGAAASRRSPP